jgi:hypothetical protein
MKKIPGGYPGKLLRFGNVVAFLLEEVTITYKIIED